MTLTLVVACAAPAPRSSLDSSQITADMLLEGSPLLPEGEMQDPPRIDVLGLTPDMQAFLDAYVNPHDNQYARLQRLTYAIMGEGKFELIYDDRTRTAQETFRDQRGNCLSFTNMFVAMARHIGLDARYEEVEIPPDWSLSGQAFLLSQHVNVFVQLSHAETRIVDFNMLDFNTSYERRIISDQRGRAHYFNNIGVEHMLGADTPGAHRNFVASVREDRTFAPAWINLGILHRREGYPAYAEAAYLQALEADRFNLVAMSNLASLYEQEGLTERAAAYRELVNSHRMRNPYYRFQLAIDAFVSGDYSVAVDHLKYAIRKRDDEPRFYSLLSLSYLMSGDKEAAQRWMKKAEAVASEAADQEKYHHKLEWLMKQGAGN
jgi:Flp pilus assembly protein TadD